MSGPNVPRERNLRVSCAARAEGPVRAHRDRVFRPRRSWVWWSPRHGCPSGSRVAPESATCAERRSDSNRSRSMPSFSHRRQICGSSRRAWSAISESCISQKRSCSAAASAARASAVARGCLECHREVPEDAPHGDALQQVVGLGAERALVAAVLDHHPALAPRMVLGAGRRDAGAAQAVRRRAALRAHRRSGWRRGSPAVSAPDRTTSPGDRAR